MAHFTFRKDSGTGGIYDVFINESPSKETKQYIIKEHDIYANYDMDKNPTLIKKFKSLTF